MNKEISETEREGRLFTNFREKNDLESFGELYAKLSPWLMRIILKISGDIDAAEDILQETWIRVVKKKGHFDPDKGKFRYYLMTIAKNEALKWKKKESNKIEKMRLFSETIEKSDTNDPHYLNERKEKAEQIKNALKELKSEYQDVLILYYFDELKVKEIADLLNKPTGTIKTWLDRGRAQLEKKLAKYIKKSRIL